MSERNGSTSSGPGTAEIPVVRPTGTPPPPPADTLVTPSPAAAAATGGDLPPEVHGTSPVTVRPAPRMPRRGPLTVMGPWAPVAGGLLGLVVGGIVAAILGGVAESFEQRLALVFVVLGLGVMGTAGTLLADEVRIVRQRSRDAGVRPQWVEATADLVNGLTPARLLLLVGVVVLVLAAYVGR
ncbi:hypothetical protein DQ244_15240 [Blastococcus sp. TBT05-19]|uniref:hypothetical protein n=1 Tax=Blastococcus sp. TBT05-19 TaxID=2250581 RepID=UPI000DEAC7F6|nr:hypothetical protein [Blastococcus sp. TBT05-19]RBY89111.1 hypothetical protein DQ244_15240 [Blastococcus sp. TBT05-19]